MHFCWRRPTFTRLPARRSTSAAALGNTISLLELLELIGRLRGEKQSIRLEDWRPGDQRYYVSDTRKFKAATGWAPKVNVQAGVERLLHWLLESRGLPAPQVMAAKGGLRAVFAH